MTSIAQNALNEFGKSEINEEDKLIVLKGLTIDIMHNDHGALE